MNVSYYMDFSGVCPVDGTRDDYCLTITSTETIPVEDILSAIERATDVPTYQEEITRMISEDIPQADFVRTIGIHSGVKTVVVA